MPNMSYTSRSIQSAAFHSGYTDGSSSSGSFENVFTISRSPVVVFSQHVHHAEAVGRVRILQVVDRRQVDQHVEARCSLEELQHGEQLARRHDEPPIVAERRLA